MNFLPTDAPESPDESPPAGQVMVRVLPLGHLKIFTGATDPLGHTPAVAEAQEAHGRVEIQ